MKIYTPTKKNLIRLQIRGKDQETKYLTFCDTNLNECITEIENLINTVCYHKKISVFSPVKTSLDFRDCKGGTNGKSKSITFKGLYTFEVFEAIKNKY